jgi:hypothetical protein
MLVWSMVVYAALVLLAVGWSVGCAQQDEEKMIEEALRRSMQELNQGSYWAGDEAGAGGGGGGGGAGGGGSGGAATPKRNDG